MANEQTGSVAEPLPTELPVPPWKYLVYRPHPVRRQLCLKGRNATAGALAAAIRADHLDPAQAADDLDLPVEAVHELLAYATQFGALISSEAAEERRYLAETGHAREPSPVPG